MNDLLRSSGSLSRESKAFEDNAQPVLSADTSRATAICKHWSEFLISPGITCEQQVVARVTWKRCLRVPAIPNLDKDNNYPLIKCVHIGILRNQKQHI